MENVFKSGLKIIKKYYNKNCVKLAVNLNLLMNPI